MNLSITFNESVETMGDMLNSIRGALVRVTTFDGQQIDGQVLEANGCIVAIQPTDDGGEIIPGREPVTVEAKDVFVY